MLQVAVVNEAACIGCTACFTACPTGAIVGAAKQIHSIIPTLCTACNACVLVCPVPCITLQPYGAAEHPLQGAQAAKGAARVAEYAALQAARLAAGARMQAAITERPQAAELALPRHLAVLAAEAREKSVQKYKKMGPIRRPRALKKP